jgi:hypothetical protein
MKRRDIYGQVLAIEGRIVVLDSDKMQVKEEKRKDDDVAVEPFARRLSPRSLVTNTPQQ